MDEREGSPAEEDAGSSRIEDTGALSQPAAPPETQGGSTAADEGFGSGAVDSEMEEEPVISQADVAEMQPTGQDDSERNSVRPVEGQDAEGLEQESQEMGVESSQPRVEGNEGGNDAVGSEASSVGAEAAIEGPSRSVAASEADVPMLESAEEGPTDVAEGVFTFYIGIALFSHGRGQPRGATRFKGGIFMKRALQKSSL